MQIAYFIAGSTGAGKTTYARKLGFDHKAQIFSIDEWMRQLFWMDAPAIPDLCWALERVRRCEQQIWSTAQRLLDAGIAVVFDLGFSKKEQRERFRRLVQEGGHQVELHFLDIPMETRLKRVLRRNVEKSKTYEFDVDEKTFEWMESHFETPDAEELRGAIVVKA